MHTVSYSWSLIRCTYNWDLTSSVTSSRAAPSRRCVSELLLSMSSIQVVSYSWHSVCIQFTSSFWTLSTRHTEYGRVDRLLRLFYAWIQTGWRYSSHLASENSACSLRSSSGRKCSITRVHSRFGDKCFAAAGSRIWNNLPTSLRGKEVSCTEFRKQLKTFMFQTDCGTSWFFWLLRLLNTLTYLFT